MRFLPVFLIAALLPAQTPKSILGTVSGFKVDLSTSEVLVKTDEGAASAVKFGLDTDVVRVPPGDHDLKHAEPARVTDLLRGDRVLISFVDGMEEARRIVLIAANDIEKRNDAIRKDWREHGIGGLVGSREGDEIKLRVGSDSLTVAITAKTTIRHYAPDAVKFSDAMFSSVADIAPGDQVQARGEKSADGLRMTAEEIVFGTFITRAGTVTQVNADSIVIQDLESKQPMTVKITADSRLKMIPDQQTIMDHMHHEAAGGKVNMARMMEWFPEVKIDDLKQGSTVVVTSTKGAHSDQVTAITVLANAEMVVKMMMPAGGQSAEQRRQMIEGHGMSPTATGGFSLPAIIP